jgi:hypothetical protein
MISSCAFSSSMLGKAGYARRCFVIGAAQLVRRRPNGSGQFFSGHANALHESTARPKKAPKFKNCERAERCGWPVP